MSSKTNGKDWTKIRAKSARVSLRAQIDVVRNGTPMADGPLVLHKSIYTSQKRFEAEQEHIFRSSHWLQVYPAMFPKRGT